MQEVSRERQRLQQQYEDSQRQIRALTGVTPPPDPRNAQVRESFSEVFPELAPLLQNPTVLKKVIEYAQSGRLDQAMQMPDRHWDGLARTVATQALTQYATAIGATPADFGQDGLAMVGANLKLFLDRDPSGQRWQRYESGQDPALISEFVQFMTTAYAAPARKGWQKAGVATVGTTRQLPAQGPTAGGVSGATTGQVPQKLDRKARREAARQHMLSANGQ